MLTPEERKARMRGILRDRAARRLLADRINPDLPVDGDPPELRHKAERMGDLLNGVLDELFAVQNTFFDRICANWKKLFPDVYAIPVRFEEDARTFKLFLSVANAGLSYALRSQMPRIRRTLKTLEGAPKKKLSFIVRIG